MTWTLAVVVGAWAVGWVVLFLGIGLLAGAAGRDAVTIEAPRHAATERCSSCAALVLAWRDGQWVDVELDVPAFVTVDDHLLCGWCREELA